MALNSSWTTTVFFSFPQTIKEFQQNEKTTIGKPFLTWLYGLPHVWKFNILINKAYILVLQKELWIASDTSNVVCSNNVHLFSLCLLSSLRRMWSINQKTFFYITILSYLYLDVSPFFFSIFFYVDFTEKEVIWNFIDYIRNKKIRKKTTKKQNKTTKKKQKQTNNPRFVSLIVFDCLTISWDHLLSAAHECLNPDNVFCKSRVYIYMNIYNFFSLFFFLVNLQEQNKLISWLRVRSVEISMGKCADPILVCVDVCDSARFLYIPLQQPLKFRSLFFIKEARMAIRFIFLRPPSWCSQFFFF